MMDDAFNFDFSNETLPDLSEHGGNSSRKRSRSNTPTPSSRSSKIPTAPSGQDDLLARKLKDTAQRNSALNELLRLSVTNYQMEGESILNELVEIVVECLDWEYGRLEDSQTQFSFKVSEAWLAPPTKETEEWKMHWKDLRDPDKVKIVEVILVIIRNLSFAAANVRLLAFSPPILAILVGSLYTVYFSSCPAPLTEDSSSSAATGTNPLALPALQTLVNLAPYLDVTGQKLLCDKLFFSQRGDDGPVFPNPDTYGQAADGRWGFGSLWLAKRLDTKEDIVADMPPKFVLDFTGSFLIQLWSLFPALCSVMSDSKSPRTVLMAALDLIKELMNQARVGIVGSVETEEIDSIPSARAILVNLPDSVVERLVDLLYVPRLGPDSLAYEDPISNIVTRVNFYKLMMNYDATVDTDVRDRSLDVLVPLLELDSPRMAARLGLNKRGLIRTRLYDSLVPILAGGVGRSESTLLGIQLLRELSKSKENTIGLAYIKDRVIEMASRDSRVAQLALSHLYTVSRTDQSEGVEEEETI